MWPTLEYPMYSGAKKFLRDYFGSKFLNNWNVNDIFTSVPFLCGWNLMYFVMEWLTYKHEFFYAQAFFSLGSIMPWEAFCLLHQCNRKLIPLAKSIPPKTLTLEHLKTIAPGGYNGYTFVGGYFLIFYILC